MNIPRKDDPDSRAYWAMIDAAAKRTAETSARLNAPRPTRVVNVKHAAPGSFVYVGRAGKGQDGYYGNPHRLAFQGQCLAPRCSHEGFPPIFHDGPGCMAAYELDLKERWERDRTFRVRALKECRGRDLGCFCVSKTGAGKCHAKPFAALLDAQPEDLLLRELLAHVTDLIAASSTGPRTPELRDFIREHEDVPEFKDLAFTLILLAERVLIREFAKDHGTTVDEVVRNAVNERQGLLDAARKINAMPKPSNPEGS